MKYKLKTSILIKRRDNRVAIAIKKDEWRYFKKSPTYLQICERMQNLVYPRADV